MHMIPQFPGAFPFAGASQLFENHKFLPDHFITEVRNDVRQPQLRHMLITYHSTLHACHIWLTTLVSFTGSRRAASGASDVLRLLTPPIRAIA